MRLIYSKEESLILTITSEHTDAFTRLDTNLNIASRYNPERALHTIHV